MDNTNKKKNKQLGLPFGTAQNKLRKNIMFDLVQKLNLDNCFHCKKKITLETFSVEHKIPWLDNNKELYWNLENIRFSHLKCNVGNARTNTLDRTMRQKKRTTLSLEKISNKLANNIWHCCSCKQDLSIEMFTKNKSKQSGLEDYCMTCRANKRNKHKHIGL